jgi:hypothetical protein
MATRRVSPIGLSPEGAWVSTTACNSSTAGGPPIGPAWRRRCALRPPGGLARWAGRVRHARVVAGEPDHPLAARQILFRWGPLSEEASDPPAIEGDPCPRRGPTVSLPHLIPAVFLHPQRPSRRFELPHADGRKSGGEGRTGDDRGPGGCIPGEPGRDVHGQREDTQGAGTQGHRIGRERHRPAGPLHLQPHGVGGHLAQVLEGGGEEDLGGGGHHALGMGWIPAQAGGRQRGGQNPERALQGLSLHSRVRDPL